MIGAILSRIREWIAVDDPDERIEGSGEAIVSPQHRRSADADRELERLEERSRENRRDEP